jgi:hypothetical protein
MSLRTAFAALLLSLALGSVQANPAARRLSLEDRLAAAEAIERVFWNHRTWPDQNPGPKPAFESVLSRAALRAKVEDSLRLSNAVERLWNRPITQAQLQAELDRIVAGTGFWHLVRGSNCGGSGSYDEASPGQVGTRDGEILAAPGACP